MPNGSKSKNTDSRVREKGKEANKESVIKKTVAPPKAVLPSKLNRPETRRAETPETETAPEGPQRSWE